MATLFSFLVAIAILFYPAESSSPAFFAFVGPLIAFVGALFLFLMPLLNVLLFRSVQKTALHYSGTALEIFRNDKIFHIANLLIVIFSIFSFAVAIDPSFIKIGNSTVLVALWIFLLGIVIDGTWLLLRRGLGYISPERLVVLCEHKGSRAIQSNDHRSLLDSFDALTEIILGGLRKNAITLPADALQQMQRMLKNYFYSCKSIAHQEATSEEGGDEIGFTLGYLLQRIGFLAEQAFQQKNEAFLGEVVNVLAKIVLSSASFDFSLTPHPLHLLRKIAVRGAKEGFMDLPVKATCSLLEIAKRIPHQIDIAYAELQPTYLGIISLFEACAKEIFRCDKKTPFPLLRHPFLDLTEELEKPPLSEHRDAEAIKRDIQRVLEEFSTLETVMNTIPPLTGEKTSQANK